MPTWPWGGPLTYFLFNRRFQALGRSCWYVGLFQSNLSRERTTGSSIMGGEANISARGGRISSLNWTCRYLLWLNSGTFQRSFALFAYLHAWGCWKLLGGREIGLGSHVFGWQCNIRTNRDEIDRPSFFPVELILFVSCIQTREQGHTVASLYYISSDFWWASSDCCEEWVYFRWYGRFG